MCADKNKTVAKLITYFGNQTKLADALGITQGTVTGWLNGKHGISEANAMKLEIITKGRFTATELCPALAQIEALKHGGANSQK